MSKSADTLEREVEASRGRLDHALGSLQSRLSAPGIPRSLADLRRTGQAASSNVERLLATTRADPVPALLICAGFGLIAYEAFRMAARRRAPAPAGSERHLAENHPDRLHARLDDALEDSFPGSDPVAVRITR